MKQISDCELVEMFDEFLDEHESVKILGMEYPVSSTLRRVDIVAYNTTFSDWLDSEMEDDRVFEIDGNYFVED